MTVNRNATYQEGISRDTRATKCRIASDVNSYLLREKRIDSVHTLVMNLITFCTIFTAEREGATNLNYKCNEWEGR